MDRRQIQGKRRTHPCAFAVDMHFATHFASSTGGTMQAEAMTPGLVMPRHCRIYHECHRAPRAGPTISLSTSLQRVPVSKTETALNKGAHAAALRRLLLDRKIQKDAASHGGQPCDLNACDRHALSHPRVTGIAAVTGSMGFDECIATPIRLPGNMKCLRVRFAVKSRSS